ncbi:MAG TPA: Na-translocating system protein MpsC family protein [Solirubrobacterales bacterium]|nr:Na-translocating system protein MpsC family protein [Solirubrobacterales bacterium]
MTTSAETSGGEPNAAVTREVIRLHVEVAGRGPDRAYSVHHANLMLTVLEGTMSAGERRLAGNGQGEAVRAMKRLVHQLMEDDLRESVGRITGRQVLALLGDSHLEPDLIVTVFVLAPGPAAPTKRGAADAR